MKPMALHEYEATRRSGVTTLMSVGDVEGVFVNSPIRQAAMTGGLVALGALLAWGIVKKAAKYGAIAGLAYYLIKR